MTVEVTKKFGWILALFLPACQAEEKCSVKNAENVAISAAKSRFPRTAAEKENVIVHDNGDSWTFEYFLKDGVGGAPIVTIRKGDCLLMRAVSTQ